MRLHILFFSDDFPPEVTAAATRVYERACYWVKWGHDVTVITNAPNKFQGRVYPGYRNRWYQVEVLDGIRVVRVKTFIAKNEGFFLRTLDQTSYMATAFIAGLFQKKPDVVAASSPQFFAAMGGWALAAIRGAPFILEIADLWTGSIRGAGLLKDGWMIDALEKLETLLYRRSSHIAVLTAAFQKELIRQGIKPEKITVIINGVDIPRYVPKKKSELLLEKYGLKGRFIIGYIGSLGSAQGIQNILYAAEHLREENRIAFMLVGPGGERDSLIEEARKRALSNVFFIPPQPKEKITDFWSLCDVALIHLSGSTVFEKVIPSKLFEAMAMGLPLLLVSPKGEASRIVEGEGVGIWVTSDDPAAFADVATFMQMKTDKCKEYSLRSRKVAFKYSRERQARSMVDILHREALKHNGAC